MCPDQKREGTESARMSRNKLLFGVYMVSSPKVTLELKFFSFAIVKSLSVHCVQTKRERVLRMLG